MSEPDGPILGGPAGEVVVGEPLEFTLRPTIDDHIALSQVMQVDARFRAIANRSEWIAAAITGLAGAYFLFRGVPTLALACGVVAIIVVVTGPARTRRKSRRIVERVLREHYGPAGPVLARLRLEDNGLREFCDGNELAISYESIERIIEAPRRAFVLYRHRGGLVIPLERVDEGDPRALVDELARRTGREVERSA